MHSNIKILQKLKQIKNNLGIQMHAHELLEIVSTVQTPKNFLVFGLGNDSILYHEINKKGVTVFLEDDPKWFAAVKQTYPQINAHLISYTTQRNQWKDLLATPQKLMLDLPDEITRIKWDIILVDGPTGHTSQSPGRMQSIYTASQLIKPDGDVFIHDVEREVELVYAHNFFKEKKFKDIIGHGVLRHYYNGIKIDIQH